MVHHHPLAPPSSIPHRIHVVLVRCPRLPADRRSSRSSPGSTPDHRSAPLSPRPPQPHTRRRGPHAACRELVVPTSTALHAPPFRWMPPSAMAYTRRPGRSPRPRPATPRSARLGLPGHAVVNGRPLRPEQHVVWCRPPDAVHEPRARRAVPAQPARAAERFPLSAPRSPRGSPRLPPPPFAPKTARAAIMSRSPPRLPFRRSFEDAWPRIRPKAPPLRLTAACEGLPPRRPPGQHLASAAPDRRQARRRVVERHSDPSPSCHFFPVHTCTPPGPPPPPHTARTSPSLPSAIAHPPLSAAFVQAPSRSTQVAAYVVAITPPCPSGPIATMFMLVGATCVFQLVPSQCRSVPLSPAAYTSVGPSPHTTSSAHLRARLRRRALPQGAAHAIVPRAPAAVSPSVCSHAPQIPPPSCQSPAPSTALFVRTQQFADPGARDEHAVRPVDGIEIVPFPLLD